MPAPHEIVASPLTLFLAEIGTAFPDVSDAEDALDAAWVRVGTEGSRNYDDGGVSVDHGETVVDFTPAGSTMPSKRFRTGESLEMELDLVDLSPIQYAKVMNDAEVVVSGNSQSFSLFRGDQVNAFAVIARGMSPLDNDLNSQFEVSKAFVSVNGKVIWTKGKPSMLSVKIQAIHHSDLDVIRFNAQSA